MASDALHRELNGSWKAATRAAFRFSVVYFTLYAAATQFLGGLLLFPGFSFPALGTIWPMRDITIWWADRVLRVSSPLIYTGNSGDTAFYWVQTLWLLLLAGVIALVWAELDRRREYTRLHAWFRLFLRFALAAQMFYYGMAKVIPTQFPRPSLVTLLEPIGNLSLADMLWTFMGASTAYQVFTGCAELLAGILLLVPHTTMLGALIGLADMTQVFVLNMTYDFGLKQISFHLILMFLFLLAPDIRRLTDAFVLNRRAAASADPPLWRTARTNRVALGLQLAFGLYLLVMFANLSLGNWEAFGGGRARSPLYGIWQVEQLSIDGQVRPPVMNAYDYRWRRVIFDAPDVVVVQRTDDSFLHYGATMEEGGRGLTLRKGSSSAWKGELAVERPAPDRLVLSGEMEGHEVEARLHLVPFDTFKLLNSGFRWIRPPDQPQRPQN